MLINNDDYINSVSKLFKNCQKFNILNNNQKLTRRNTLQIYFNKLSKRSEIKKCECDIMRPNNAKPARTHGLPKIHKNFTDVPKFRPIIDTTGTSHCVVGKYLANLLNPLTIKKL